MSQPPWMKSETPFDMENEQYHFNTMEMDFQKEQPIQEERISSSTSSPHLQGEQHQRGASGSAQAISHQLPLTPQSLPLAGQGQRPVYMDSPSTLPSTPSSFLSPAMTPVCTQPIPYQEMPSLFHEGPVTGPIQYMHGPFVPQIQPVPEEKPKKQRKSRAKAVKEDGTPVERKRKTKEPTEGTLGRLVADKAAPKKKTVKNAVLKSLLSNASPNLVLAPDSTTQQERLAMFAQQNGQNFPMNAANPQCSSYMQPGVMADFPEFDWSANQQQQFYQQQQMQYPPAAPLQPARSQKRKPAAPQAERPAKQPYAYQYQMMDQQPGFDAKFPGLQEPVMGYKTDNSPPFWPSSQQANRSEMVRMELRQSLQARQHTNANNNHNHAVAQPLEELELQFAATPLEFDLDVILKDADGSLMHEELDTVYDFKLGNGCGFQFDMENDATRCLVMKLLS